MEGQKMSATVPLSSTTHKPGWILTVNGTELPPETEWQVNSKFGSVETAVVLDSNGKPVYKKTVSDTIGEIPEGIKPELNFTEILRRFAP
jgi:hypothetical protein